MVVQYHSQYRKHYKDPHWDEVALSEYNRKVDYRVGRRSVEHFHQPWDWESQDDTNSESEAGSERQQRAAREKVEMRDIAVEAKEKRHKKSHRKDRDSARKSTAEPSQKRQHERKTDDERRTGQKASQKPREVVKSASNMRKERGSSKGPFVSYGWANEGPIDKKYTYNVRASPTEVYPASMRALKRRELDVKRRLFESQKKATKEEAMLREKTFKDARASSTFLTEYQRSFCLQNI